MPLLEQLLAIRAVTPIATRWPQEPMLSRRTPRASSSAGGGTPGRAKTFTGPSIAASSRSIVSRPVAVIGKRQSAPAAR